MNNLLPTVYQQFIHKSRYARWIDEESRRENWDETVDRYIRFMQDHVLMKHNVKLQDGTVNEIRDSILSLQVMPSMRAMMTAGAAADRDNICMYNCSYLHVDHPHAFDEAMFILLCGTGVGFSVERDYQNKHKVFELFV